VGGRVFFLLVGANPNTPIINWINNMSEIFIYPFRGLFQSIILTSNSAIDVTAIIALLGYALVFSFLYKIVYILSHSDVTTDLHSHTHVGY
jgi:uncharacterized protein YggT (Ycf19 family)